MKMMANFEDEDDVREYLNVNMQGFLYMDVKKYREKLDNIQKEKEDLIEELDEKLRTVETLKTQN